MIGRRQFLTSAALPLLARSGGPRNVLLVVGSGFETFSFEGVRFPNAFSTTGSAAAGLSVIHSGLHNHANGHYGEAMEFRHFAYHDFVRPLSSLLKDAGYRTGVLGEMHVNPVRQFRWDVKLRDIADAASFVSETPWFLHICGTAPGIEGLLPHLSHTLVICTGTTQQAGTRVPLIVRLPSARHGKPNPAMVSLIDIAPTILDWTGVAGPAYDLHGQSLLSPLKSRDCVYFSHTFHTIDNYAPLRGVRTVRYRYVHNLDPAREELYDLAVDPAERHNLARSADYSHIRNQLRNDTSRFRARTQDPWLMSTSAA